MNINGTGMKISFGNFEFQENWTVEIQATLSLREDLSQDPTQDTSVNGKTSRKRPVLKFLCCNTALSGAEIRKPHKGCGKPLMI